MIAALRTLVAALILAAAHTPVLAAGPELDRIKMLYAEASYEAALEALDGLSAADRETPDAMQYRILCLLALNRIEDAERTAEALVTAAPMLHPSAEEFPRRFMTLFNETRVRVLPEVMAKILAEAREHYRQSRRTEAIAQFEKLVELSKDEGAPPADTIADMRTLAEGFLDLLRASSPAPAPGGTDPQAAERADAPTAVPNRARDIVAAVPIQQVFPAWTPPDRVTAALTLRGSIVVMIGTDGKVVSASIQESVHPQYDAVLLRATRTWTYQPATLGGVPVESQRVINIELKPQTTARE